MRRSMLLLGVLTALSVGGVVGAFFLPWPSDQTVVVVTDSPEPEDTSFSADGGCCTIPPGRWRVGRDFAHGVYRVTVANESGCYWERSMSADINLEAIIQNGFAKRGDVVTLEIKKTDVSFFSSGCGDWEWVGGR